MPDPYVSVIEVGVNCYIDIDDADDYFEVKYGADAWARLDDEVKDKLLISATRKIDRLPLKGYKRSTTQDLAFPRYFGTYMDYDAALIYSEDIPVEVERATCEEAWAMYNNPEGGKRRELQRQGVKSYSIGKLSETLSGNAVISLLSEEAADLLKSWIARRVKII